MWVRTHSFDGCDGGAEDARPAENHSPGRADRHLGAERCISDGTERAVRRITISPMVCECVFAGAIQPPPTSGPAIVVVIHACCRPRRMCVQHGKYVFRVMPIITTDTRDGLSQNDPLERVRFCHASSRRARRHAVDL